MKLTARSQFLILALLCCGCHYFYDQMGDAKRIPVPVPEKFPHPFEGELYRVWMGNEIQLKSRIQTAYLLLEGVNNPDLGADMERQAVDFMYSLLTNPKIRATIQSVDEQKRMFAQVYCGDNHINLEMIKAGWGTYDGIECEWSTQFARAQEDAKAKKLGIWRSQNTTND